MDRVSLTPVLPATPSHNEKHRWRCSIIKTSHGIFHLIINLSAPLQLKKDLLSIANRMLVRHAMYLIAIKDECWVSLNDKEKSGCVVLVSPKVLNYTTTFLHSTTAVIADAELAAIQH